jgi:hypothetical protein
MWPRDRTEWNWSFIGCAAAMVVLVTWGLWPAIIFTMFGAGALMIWSKLRSSRQ